MISIYAVIVHEYLIIHNVIHVPIDSIIISYKSLIYLQKKKSNEQSAKDEKKKIQNSIFKTVHLKGQLPYDHLNNMSSYHHH